jgi:hypothetical protein
MIIIGEKINGTIPGVAEAIRAKNREFIHEPALRQRDRRCRNYDEAYRAGRL